MSLMIIFENLIGNIFNCTPGALTPIQEKWKKNEIGADKIIQIFVAALFIIAKKKKVETAQLPISWYMKCGIFTQWNSQ